MLEARSSSVSGPVSAPERRPEKAFGARGGAAAEGGYTVELRSAADIQSDLEAWRGLAHRALEPSLFAEPDVLLAAMQHLSDGRHVTLLLVWQQGPAGRALRGLFPVLMPRVPLAPGEVRLWQPHLFGFGMPLVDGERPPSIVEAALAFCAGRGTRYGGLMLPRLPDGPLAAALAAISQSSRRRLERFPASHAANETRLLTLTAAGRVSARRSGTAGSAFTVEHARGPLQIRDAVETFLLIEAASAKARGARAIVQDPGSATFLRTMTRQLGRGRRCRVDLLRRDGRTPAAAISVESAQATWVWLAALPDAGSAADWLAAYLAAAGSRRKHLFVTNDGSLSLAAAAQAGLEPLPLADVLVSTRPGRAPGAVATQLRRRLDRGLRSLAGAHGRGLRHLLGAGAAPRPAAASPKMR